MIFKDDSAFQKIGEKEGRVQIKIPFDEKDCVIKVLANYAVAENSSLENKVVFEMKNLDYCDNKKQESWFL